MSWPASSSFPSASASASAIGLRFSSTTCRARRATTRSSAPEAASSSSGVTSRKARMSGASARMPATAASHADRRSLYSLSASLRRTPVSMTTMATSAGTTEYESSNERQSNSMACPLRLALAAIWSMIPHCTPTRWFSASCASRAMSTGSHGISNRPHIARATASSNAADDDNPAPTGTSPVTRIFAPAMRECLDLSAQTMALRYRSPVASSGDATLSRSSDRRETATRTRRWIAMGRTNPSL